MPQQAERNLAFVYYLGLFAQEGQPVFEIFPRGRGQKLQLNRPFGGPGGENQVPSVRSRIVPRLLYQNRQGLFSCGAQPLGRRTVPADFCGNGAEELVNFGH